MPANEWALIPLHELVEEFVNGGTPSTEIEKYWSGSIPWITGADIKSFRVSTGRKRITEEALERSSTHLVHQNTVLLVTRTSVGKVGISANPLCFSQDITGIRCKPAIRPDYLARYLGSIQDQLTSRTRGATIKGLARGDFHDIRIPVPPIETQERIALVLDHGERLAEKRADANEMMGKITKSIFLKMFGDPAANPKGWPMTTIGDVVKNVQYGLSKRLSDNPEHVPIVRMNNITVDGKLVLDEMRYVDIGRDEFAAVCPIEQNISLS
jgi:type I restriction enzyme S subunit